MEADQTLMLNSDQERKEVYSQQCRIQVMTSGETDDKQGSNYLEQ